MRPDLSQASAPSSRSTEALAMTSAEVSHTSRAVKNNGKSHKRPPVNVNFRASFSANRKFRSFGSETSKTKTKACEGAARVKAAVNGVELLQQSGFVSVAAHGLFS